MSQPSQAPGSKERGYTTNRLFARYYERSSRNAQEEKFMRPLRSDIVGRARGQVLEIGAGNGLNFAFYQPDKVEHVEATEPDNVMLEYAHERAAKAPVQVQVMQAAVEHLPFADESFDSVVVTLVFCSVKDPLRGLGEIRRVLKPEGRLLMLEHVRSHNTAVAVLQHMVTPLTRLLAGNCHWNRETEKTVRTSGFKIEERRDIAWGMMPLTLLDAVK